MLEKISPWWKKAYEEYRKNNPFRSSPEEIARRTRELHLFRIKRAAEKRPSQLRQIKEIPIMWSKRGNGYSVGLKQEGYSTEYEVRFKLTPNRTIDLNSIEMKKHLMPWEITMNKSPEVTLEEYRRNLIAKILGEGGYVLPRGF